MEDVKKEIGVEEAMAGLTDAQRAAIESQKDQVYALFDEALASLLRDFTIDMSSQGMNPAVTVSALHQVMSFQLGVVEAMVLHRAESLNEKNVSMAEVKKIVLEGRNAGIRDGYDFFKEGNEAPDRPPAFCAGCGKVH